MRDPVAGVPGPRHFEVRRQGGRGGEGLPGSALFLLGFAYDFTKHDYTYKNTLFVKHISGQRVVQLEN